VAGRLGDEDGHDSFVNSAFATLLAESDKALDDGVNDAKEAIAEEVVETDTIIMEPPKEPIAEEVLDIGTIIMEPPKEPHTMESIGAAILVPDAEPVEFILVSDDATFEDLEEGDIITPAQASIMSDLPSNEETSEADFFDEEGNFGVKVDPEPATSSVAATQKPLFQDLPQRDEEAYPDQSSTSYGKGGSAIAALIVAFSQYRKESHERKSQKFITKKHLTAEKAFLKSHERVLNNIAALGASECARKCAALDLDHPDSKTIARETFAKDADAQDMWEDLSDNMETFNADALSYVKMAKAAGIEPESVLATVENAKESISQSGEKRLAGMFNKAGDKLSKLIEESTARIVEKVQQIINSITSMMTPSPS